MTPRFKIVPVSKKLIDAIEDYKKCHVEKLNDLDNLISKLVNFSEALKSDVASQNAQGNYLYLSNQVNNTVEKLSLKDKTLSIDCTEEELKDLASHFKELVSHFKEYIEKDAGNSFKRNISHHMSKNRVKWIGCMENSTETHLKEINLLQVENQDQNNTEQNSPTPEGINSDNLYLLNKCISYIGAHINKAKKNPHYFLDGSYNRRVMTDLYSLLSIFNKILENHGIRLQSIVCMMNYIKNFKIGENPKSNCNELYNELNKIMKDIVKVKKPRIVQNLISNQIFPSLTSLKEITNQSKEQICYTENLHSKSDETIRMLNRNYPLSRSLSVEDIYFILSSLIDMIGTLESGGSPKPYFEDETLPATNFKKRIQNYAKFFYDMNHDKDKIVEFLDELSSFYCTGSSEHRMSFLFSDEEDEINKWCKRIIDDIKQNKVNFKDD